MGRRSGAAQDAESKSVTPTTSTNDGGEAGDDIDDDGTPADADRGLLGATGEPRDEPRMRGRAPSRIDFREVSASFKDGTPGVGSASLGGGGQRPRRWIGGSPGGRGRWQLRRMPQGCDEPNAPGGGDAQSSPKMPLSNEPLGSVGVRRQLPVAHRGDCDLGCDCLGRPVGRRMSVRLTSAPRRARLVTVLLAGRAGL